MNFLIHQKNSTNIKFLISIEFKGNKFYGTLIPKENTTNYKESICSKIKNECNTNTYIWGKNRQNKLIDEFVNLL